MSAFEKYVCLWMSVGVWYENDKEICFPRHVVIRLGALADGWDHRNWGWEELEERYLGGKEKAK